MDSTLQGGGGAEGPTVGGLDPAGVGGAVRGQLTEGGAEGRRSCQELRVRGDYDSRIHTAAPSHLHLRQSQRKPNDMPSSSLRSIRGAATLAGGR